MSARINKKNKIKCNYYCYHCLVYFQPLIVQGHLNNLIVQGLIIKKKIDYDVNTI